VSVASAKRRYTLAEYQALEQDSEAKHEYFQGEIFAMAGASIRHNEICGNLYHALRKTLQGHPCRSYLSDQRFSIRPAGLYTYADTTVICGPLQVDERDSEAIVNPQVIFEVLSPSTENYDRGKKWEFYQQLDSLREYVLVSQDEPKITRYFLDKDGGWHYSLITGLDQTLHLKSLDCDMKMAEIYDNVQFGGPPEENADTSHGTAFEH
jgi:Uma2 family endonuclease